MYNNNRKGQDRKAVSQVLLKVTVTFGVVGSYFFMDKIIDNSAIIKTITKLRSIKPPPFSL
jgi:hypothetical protein